MRDDEKTVLNYGFELLTADNRELFDNFMSMADGPLSSCSNLPSIIGWENSTVPYFKVVDGALCIIFNDAVYHTWICFPPMCSYNKKCPEKALEFLDGVFRAMGLPFRMYYVKEWMLPYFESSGKFNIQKKYDDSLSDYIYSFDDFLGYLNKADIKYNIRYFLRRFEPSVEWLSSDNLQEYLDFLKQVWCPFHSCNECVYGCMLDALRNMLENAEKTGFKSFLIRSQGKCVAYAGYTVCGTELEVLVKKVSRSMKGVTDFVHKVIIENAGDGIEQINYTEDMGVVGLRKFKQKLAPYTLSRNYELILGGTKVE